MNYSKYVLTFLGSIIAGICLDMAFEEISSQSAVVIIIMFIVVGFVGEIISDIVENKRRRKEAELEEKKREEFFSRLEEVIHKNSQENNQVSLEKTDKVVEILNIHTMNFEEYLNFHVNHQKSLEKKVSDLLKIVNSMDSYITEDKKDFEQSMIQSAVEQNGVKQAVIELKEELGKNTKAVKESGKQISDTGNKLLEKIESLVVENAEVKEYCKDIYSSQKQIMEEIADRSSILSEQCEEIRKQIEREAELIWELKPILEQAEELKRKYDEMIHLKNEWKSKLGITSNNQITEMRSRMYQVKSKIRYKKRK